MHSNIGLKEALLYRGNTNFCFGGGWSKSINVLNNCLVIDKQVKEIKKDCFGMTFIGPGETIIFEDYVVLQRESITSGQFKHIVFKKDALIDDRAFFLKNCNSNLHHNYTLYCYENSNVERFAHKYGFKFKKLEEFNYKKKVKRYHYTSSYRNWISFVCGRVHLYFTDDYADIIKEAYRENGEYVYYRIPCVEKQFAKSIKAFINEFANIANDEEKEHLIISGENNYLRLEGEATLKYTNLLIKYFKNHEIIKDFETLSKESN